MYFFTKYQPPLRNSAVKIFDERNYTFLWKYDTSLMAGCCENGNEPSYSTKQRALLDKRRNHYLFKKVSAPRTWLVG